MEGTQCARYSIDGQIRYYDLTIHEGHKVEELPRILWTGKLAGFTSPYFGKIRVPGPHLCSSLGYVDLGYQRSRVYLSNMQSTYFQNIVLFINRF